MKRPLRWLTVVLVAFGFWLVVRPAPLPTRAAGPWYVATTGNDANMCLSAAQPCKTINGALAKPSFVAGDTIRVAIGTYTSVNGEVVLVSKNATLSGGWNNTFTSQLGWSTVDGENARRGVTVNSGITATVERFIIQHGYANGAGVYNDNGTLMLINSRIINNSSSAWPWHGGGILSYGTLHVVGSTIRDNGTSGFGGGISSYGITTIDGSAILYNSSYTGAGIFPAGIITITNSTLAYNWGLAIDPGGDTTITLDNVTILNNLSGINMMGATNLHVYIRNSILAGSTAGANCYGPLTSLGYNLFGNMASCTFTPGPGDVVNADPGVGDLYGSPEYFPLRLDSPAVNAGNPTGCLGNNGSLTTDQRGVPRDAHCDIGAFEYVTPGTPAVLSIVNPFVHFMPPNTPDPRPLQVSVHDGQGNLAHNVTATFTAPSSGASGTFATTGTRVATVFTDNSGVATAPVYTANNLEGEYTLGATVTGALPVAFTLHNVVWYLSAETGSRTNNCMTPATSCRDFWQLLTFSALEDHHIVRVASGTYTNTDPAVATIDHSLTLSGGWNTAFTAQTGTSILDGGHARNGIDVSADLTVTLDRFTVRNALVGLNSAAASLTFSQGEISHSDQRGVVITAGHTRLSNVTLGDNQGGLSVSTGSTATVASSTIAGNRADSGAGIRNLGGTVALKNSIVANNTLSTTGGIDCAGTLTSGGYNLIGHTTGCTVITATGDLLDIDPQLSAWLIGAPGYYAFRSTSPAIEGGNPAGCTDASGVPLTSDVRGAPRDAHCDIGAYEYLTPTAAAQLLILSGTPQNSRPLTLFSTALRVVVQDSLGTPLSGVPVIFNAPASGPSGTFSDTQTISTTAISDQDGVATAAPFQANSQAGGYSISASANGVSAQTFQLFNSSAWYVSTTGNNGNSCLLPSTPCATLNGALAKVQPGDDILAAGGIYSDTGEAVILIDKNVQISGGWNAAFTAQTDAAILDGQGQRRGVIVNPGITVTLEHFTIQSGVSGAGSGLYNAGQLSLSNLMLSNNTCGGVYQSLGGGIYNAGTLTMSQSSVSNGGGCFYGGGLYNENGGIATLDQVVLSGNSALFGGSLNNHGRLTLSDSSVFNSQTNQGNLYNDGWNGGGLYNVGQAYITRTTFAQNNAYNGGGIFNTGDLVVYDSTIMSSTVNTYASGRAAGSGIFNGGQLRLENSAVLGNTGYDSTIGTTTPPDSPHGGGIYNSAVMTVSNSLIAHNRVRKQANADDPPLGGGVFNAGTAELNNTTLVDNAAQSGGSGGGLYNAAGTLHLHNTIVTGNTAEGDSPDCGGSILSAGYNLIGDIHNCAFSATVGDLINTSVRFMAQMTPIDYRLRYDSPAINAGDPAGCVNSIGLPIPPIDFRGLSRPVGRCDIGAVEMQALEASAVLVGRVHAINRTPISYTVQLRNLADVDVAGVVMTDRVPGAVIYQPDSLTATLGLPMMAGDLITWTGTLSASSTVNIVFGATVSPAAIGGSWVTNTAYVHWDDATFAPSRAFRVMSDLYLPTVAHNFCADFSDDFSTAATHWPVGEDAYVRAQYLNGEYQLFSKVGGYLYGFASPACAQDLYRVEVDARWAEAAASGDGYAVLFDIAPDFSRYGVFYVSADYGDFALNYRDAAGVHQIAPFTPSTAIKRGAASNHLTVIRRADSVTLLVNGVTLGSWWYPSVTGFTRTGVAMQSYGSRPQADARFDNFAVYRMSPSAAPASVKSTSAAPVESTAPIMRGFAAEVWRQWAWSGRSPLGRSEH